MSGKLHPEIKAKWLEALRSGEFEQGREYLHRVDGRMCCLGVLCDLAAREGVVQAQEYDHVSSDYTTVSLIAYSPGTNYAMPPSTIEHWAFEDPSDPGEEVWAVFDRGELRSLASLNDDVGLGFAEIADLIEASL